MDGYSQTPLKERLEALRSLIPEAFTEGKIDWEKLKAALGEEVNFSNERYVLNWAGKSDAFRIMQQPSAATLVSCKEESVDFDNTENIFIEGENMEVLKVLQKSYFGKVKMIYIDPPYNTGNDSFIYPDKFSETKEEYQKRVGDKDADGYMMRDGMFQKNSRENGQYHSNWLNMMMTRLYLAKSLLRDDGVIFVSIDDNEVHNLRLLMNEIFGEENFVASIVWQKKYAATNDSKGFSTTHDYIVVYQKSELFNRNLLPRTEEQNLPYKNDDNDGKGLWRSDNLLVKSFSESGVYPIINPNTGKEYYPPKGSCWRASKETMETWLSENRIFFGKDGKGAPQLKRYLNEVQQGRVPITWWTFDEVGHNDEANKELSAIFESKTPFDTPKPTRLIKQALLIGSDKDSIILDFFAGSGTTAHAVMQLNKEDGGHRKFICVQLPEPCDEKSEAYKAGYNTIAEIAKERIRRAGAKLASPPTPLHVERGASAPFHVDRGAAAKENLFKGATPDLFSKANELRIERKTEAEDALWQHLRNRQVENCKFRRQHPLGHFIADFYCHEKHLVIEVDGGYHLTEEQKAYDEARTEAINQYGIQVVRFTNEQVLTDMDYVISEIRNILAPHPLSSPQEESEVDLGFKVFKLQDSNFKQWRNIPGANKEEWKQQIIDFINPVAENATVENMMYELLLKSGKSLNSKIEHADSCYCINGGELALLLESVSQATVDAVLSRHPQKVIALDKLFEGNDQLKTNTALQMRDAGVEFKTI
ncbi:MAG: DUF559 domain-containing protein [Bacteroidales bacterium]|nr:DUF559 domain-containing protein [Bacteroidales bacterium]